MMILSLIPISFPHTIAPVHRDERVFCACNPPHHNSTKVFWESNEEEVDTIYTCRIYVWFLGHYLIFFNKKLSNNAASCIFSSGNLSWKFQARRRNEREVLFELYHGI